MNGIAENHCIAMTASRVFTAHTGSVFLASGCGSPPGHFWSVVNVFSDET